MPAEFDADGESIQIPMEVGGVQRVIIHLLIMVGEGRWTIVVSCRTSYPST